MVRTALLNFAFFLLGIVMGFTFGSRESRDEPDRPKAPAPSTSPPVEDREPARPASDRPEAAPASVDRHDPIDYGAYLVDTGGCKVCHKDDLRGGLHPLSLPGEPPPPDLTRGGPLASWSESDFIRTLRTGVTPDGRQLDAQWMPWPTTARMTDGELRAIWQHLQSLPGIEPRQDA